MDLEAVATHKAGRVQPQEAHGIDPVRGTLGQKIALATHATARLYTSLKKVWVRFTRRLPEAWETWRSMMECGV